MTHKMIKILKSVLIMGYRFITCVWI